LPLPMTTPTVAAPPVVPLKNWSVTAAAPVFTGLLTATGSAGWPFAYQIAAANLPVSYNATGLPAGLSLNASSGLISGTALAAGTSTVTLTAANSSGTTTATLGLTMLGSPYNTWRSQYFSTAQLLSSSITGDAVVLAGDGISNIMKYALNLNPWTNGAGGLPKVGTTVVGHTAYLTLTYTQVVAAIDITYTPQLSADLETWNSGPAYISEASRTPSGNGATQTVTVRAVQPLTSGSGQFIRLNVMGP